MNQPLQNDASGTARHRRSTYKRRNAVMAAVTLMFVGTLAVATNSAAYAASGAALIPLPNGTSGRDAISDEPEKQRHPFSLQVGCTITVGAYPKIVACHTDTLRFEWPDRHREAFDIGPDG